MKRCHPAFLLIAFCLSFAASSQDLELSGIVTDGVGNPFPYANVILKDAESTILSGTITEEDGRYFFKDLAEGDYQVSVSFVGFITYESGVITLSRKRTLPNIILEEDTQRLDEVVVTAKRPTITKQADRLTFNVENTSLSQNNTFDILKYTPSVLVVEGEIKIRNQDATVYINDKRVYLTGDELRELLESYDGQNVKAIEVITNPGARYDAEGGLVLNIKTSKNIIIGYKGSVNTRYTQGTYAKYALSTSHYYKTKNANLFASYTFSPRKENKTIDSDIRFFNPDGSTNQLWDSDFRRVTRSGAHNLNTIFDFDLSPRQTLSLTSNILYSPNRTFDNTNRTNISDTNGNALSSFKNLSDVSQDKTNITLNADYNLALRDDKSAFAFTMNYIYYDEDQAQDLNTSYFDAGGALDRTSTLNFITDQRSSILTGQLDFTGLLQEDVSVEMGAKISTINSSSTVDYSGSFTGPGVIDDDFDYDETIYAAYGSLSKDFNKWSLVLGSRAEYTEVVANSIALDQRNDQSYMEIFPNASLGYYPNENHGFDISYKRSIARPRYQSLNPFRYYLNEVSFNSGNPNLTRAIKNTFNLDYTLKGEYFFSLYYETSKNALESLAFQNNTTFILEGGQFNILEQFQYSLDFVYAASVKPWWYFSSYTSAAYLGNRFIARESGGVTQEIAEPVLFVQLFNRFTLSKDGTLTSDFTGQYLSKYVTGSYVFDNQLTLGLSFRKSIWNKQGAITLAFNDFTNGTNVRLRSRYRNQDNGFFAMPESRTVTLGFNYKFGNFKLSDNERDLDLKEQERLESKTAF